MVGGVAVTSAGATIGGGAAFAGAAAAGAAGSLASQVVGIATGIQDKISWKGVAIAALSAGITRGLEGQISKVAGAIKGVATDAVGKVAGRFVEGAVNNVVSQGIGLATGAQKRFDWAGVATSAILNGVGANRLVGNIANLAPEGLARDLVGSAAGAIASSAGRSLVTGTSFGDNLQSALPQAIGNTIGNAIAGGLAARSSSRPLYADDVPRGQLAGLGDAGLADAVHEVSEVVVTGRRTGPQGFFSDLIHGRFSYLGTDLSNDWHSFTRAFAGGNAGVDGTYSNYLYYQPQSQAEERQLRQEQAQFSTMVATQIDPIGRFAYAHPRIAGGVGVATDVVGVVGGVVGGIATSETGVGAVAGGAVAYTSLSNLKADFNQAVTGQRGTSLTYDISRGLGASPGLAQGIDVGSNLLTVGVGIGGVASSGRLFSAGAVARTAPLDFGPIAAADDAAGSSLRLRYMGATPDKFSRTGAAVVERMRGEGFIQGEGPLLRGNPNNLQLVGPSGALTTIDATVDMAHQIDAVTWWNQTGRFLGPKSPGVREFMLNPDNYALQPSSINRSAGASLRQTYQPPAAPDFTTLKR